jgi:hypothetical protein
VKPPPPQWIYAEHFGFDSGVDRRHASLVPGIPRYIATRNSQLLVAPRIHATLTIDFTTRLNFERKNKSRFSGQLGKVDFDFSSAERASSKWMPRRRPCYLPPASIAPISQAMRVSSMVVDIDDCGSVIGMEMVDGSVADMELPVPMMQDAAAETAANTRRHAAMAARWYERSDRDYSFSWITRNRSACAGDPNGVRCAASGERIIADRDDL